MTTAPTASLLNVRGRVASLPASLLLGALVGLSFLLRLAASVGHATPRWFPDEYIYATLGRSLAHGSVTIRGSSVGFPALLEPLLAAPLWRLAGDDLELGYRLVQGMHALVVSLTAVPVYLIARRLGLSPHLGLACAALTLLLPVLSMSPAVMADAVALPLALGAVAAGTAALDRPTRASQTAFVVLCGLAAFARIQYVVLPVAFLAASVVVSRWSIRRLVREYGLTLLLLAVPAAAIALTGPQRVLGYYRGVVDIGLDVPGIARWLASDTMLLAYAAGWVLVPGALAGIAFALVRPENRAERGFAALASATVILLLSEAAVYAANGAERFQERYLMALLPLAPLLFCVGARRLSGRRGQIGTILVAAILLLVAAVVPLSGYAAWTGKQDSPTLWAVSELGRHMGVGASSLGIAVLAGALAVAAAALVRRPTAATPVTLCLAGGVLALMSIGAVRYDGWVSKRTVTTYGETDQRWVDHAGLGSVSVLQTPYSSRQQVSSQMFWNESVTRILRMPNASEVDAFGSRPVAVARDGRLLVDGATVRAPLLVEEYTSWAALEDARLVRRTINAALWQPSGPARLSLLLAGRYFDSMLGAESSVTIWPGPAGRRKGTLALRLYLPPGNPASDIEVEAPGVRRTITVPGGGEMTLRLTVDARGGPWRAELRPLRPFSASGGRLIAALADPPRFTENSRSEEVSAVKGSGDSADN